MSYKTNFNSDIPGRDTRAQPRWSSGALEPGLENFSCRISSPTIFLGFGIPRTPCVAKLDPGKFTPRTSQGCVSTTSHNV
jgi:hypothetical protein